MKTPNEKPWVRKEFDRLCDLPMAQVLGTPFTIEYFTRLIAFLQTASQDVVHHVVFRLSGLALSYGEPYASLVPAYVPVTIEKHVLGLSNCLSALKDDPLFASLLSHPDFLVRWCAMDCIRQCSPVDAEHWRKNFSALEKRLQDERPELSAYAAYILEDYRLDKANYDLRALPKTDKEKLDLIDKMRRHRKCQVLTLESIALSFPSFKKGKSYTRPELDRYVDAALREHDGNIVCVPTLR